MIDEDKVCFVSKYGYYIFPEPEAFDEGMISALFGWFIFFRFIFFL